MIDERFASTELETAAYAAKQAHARLSGLPEKAADYRDALVQDGLDAKAEIRAVLDRLAEKYNAPAADVTDAMGWVDDGLEDLLYDIEQDYVQEMDGEDPA